ncbi:hypothetical protein GCM10022200_30070 [Microbacterium awajiense]|uniref:Leucyl-tRNA synthetase n=2 Tax=Microbacterium awajiense TaxID=415214 RepID=A0ABP7AYZ8_9MICO
MDAAMNALLEIFSWVGVGLGLSVLLVALIARLADGTWLPARAVVEDGPNGRFVRWFDADGAIGQAPLTAEQDGKLAGKDMADIYYRHGWTDRMRLDPRSPAVRPLTLLGTGLVAFGLACAIASWVLLALSR